MCPDLHVFGPELREQAVETLGKYSLLGEAAAVRHCPMLLTIALCEHEATGVRVCAMQVRSGARGGVRRRWGRGGGGCARLRVCFVSAFFTNRLEQFALTTSF